MSQDNIGTLNVAEQSLYQLYLPVFDPLNSIPIGEMGNVAIVQQSAIYIRGFLTGKDHYPIPPGRTSCTYKDIAKILGIIDLTINNYKEYHRILGNGHSKPEKLRSRLDKFSMVYYMSKEPDYPQFHHLYSHNNTDEDKRVFAVLAAITINDFMQSIDPIKTNPNIALNDRQRARAAPEYFHRESLKLAVEVGRLMEQQFTFSEIERVEGQAPKKIGSRGGRGGREDYAGLKEYCEEYARRIKTKFPNSTLHTNHRVAKDCLQEVKKNNIDLYNAACRSKRLKFADDGNAVRAIRDWIALIIPPKRPIKRRKNNGKVKA